MKLLIADDEELTIEDIPQFFTSLTPEDIKEIENELMQTL